MNDQFDRLIADAEAQQMSGWDWSYVEGRYSEAQPPWDYREKVQAHLQPNLTLLDMGTGGGELLASMAPLPNNTWATEGYPPNISFNKDEVRLHMFLPLNLGGSHANPKGVSLSCVSPGNLSQLSRWRKLCPYGGLDCFGSLVPGWESTGAWYSHFRVADPRISRCRNEYSRNRRRLSEP